MNTYGPKAEEVIEKTLHEFSEGKLRNGSSGARVTDRKQALAIGISKARAQHLKTPSPRGEK